MQQPPAVWAKSAINCTLTVLGIRVPKASKRKKTDYAPRTGGFQKDAAGSMGRSADSTHEVGGTEVAAGKGRAGCRVWEAALRGRADTRMGTSPLASSNEVPPITGTGTQHRGLESHCCCWLQPKGSRECEAQWPRDQLKQACCTDTRPQKRTRHMKHKAPHR